MTTVKSMLILLAKGAVIVNSFHDVNKSSLIFLLSYIKPGYLKAKFNKTKWQLSKKLEVIFAFQFTLPSNAVSLFPSPSIVTTVIRLIRAIFHGQFVFKRVPLYLRMRKQLPHNSNLRSSESYVCWGIKSLACKQTSLFQFVSPERRSLVFCVKQRN